MLSKGDERGQNERECCDSGLSRACSHALFLAIWPKASGNGESSITRASFGGTGLCDSPVHLIGGVSRSQLTLFTSRRGIGHAKIAFATSNLRLGDENQSLQAIRASG